MLYGEAYSEPFPRNLYGGWAGSGSNEDQKPEKLKLLRLPLIRILEALNILSQFMGLK